jgi:dolichol-phosphate mannosyltransferase
VSARGVSAPLEPGAPKALQLLSVVVPARDEEESLPSMVRDVHAELNAHRIPHEIIVSDDGSEDRTPFVLEQLASEIEALRGVRNPGPYGFGRAVIYGLEHAKGDAVAIMMADGSDGAKDLVTYWNKLNDGYDCVFGSRFIKDGQAIDYPMFKLIVNRLANSFIKYLFHIKLNDTTNAFKAYRMETIDGCRPLISPHFNLTVELPLKAIVRGFTWTVVPISWRNRRAGIAKLKMREMGSRYLFICLYLWLEKYFSRGDYLKRGHSDGTG